MMEVSTISKQCNQFTLPLSPASGKSNSSSTVSRSDHNKKMISRTKNLDISKYMDALSVKDEQDINILLANFIFGCNIPFRVVESAHFKNFLQKLRPAYVKKIPNRKQLSTNLLETVYEACVAQNKTKVGMESVLLIDGWKNTSSNSKIVVCMLHTANGEQAFLHAWDLSGESESGDRLAEIVTEAVNIAKAQFQTDVYAVVSDNASTMVKMGKLVNHFVWHSNCNSHTGNLLAKDMINTKLNEKVMMVLKEFKKTDYEKFIVLNGGTKIKLPCDTRWCSNRDAYKCLINNLTLMKRIAADPSQRKVQQNVAKMIFDEEFIEEVNNYINMFDPICHLINKCQSPECSIADSANLWLELKFPEIFQNKYELKIEERKKMALNVYSLTAYYLHPNYDIKKLQKDQLDHINLFLFQQLNNAGIEDWHAFKTGTGFFQLLRKKNIENSLVFWGMAEIKHPTLARLAIKLLKIPASSAQIERCFSSWGLVHTSIRNRLTFDRSQKLLQIYSSLRLQDQLNYDSDE